MAGESSTCVIPVECALRCGEWVCCPFQRARTLSYKLGDYTLWQLRREAEEELGDEFDVRAFHNFILALGSVTLDILQDEVRAWVAEHR